MTGIRPAVGSIWISFDYLGSTWIIACGRFCLLNDAYTFIEMFDSELDFDDDGLWIGSYLDSDGDESLLGSGWKVGDGVRFVRRTGVGSSRRADGGLVYLISLSAYWLKSCKSIFLLFCCSESDSSSLSSHSCISLN